MDNRNRTINILVWNIRGINSQAKWDALRDKISKSAPSIICLQETKHENFEYSYIRKFCPRHLNHFQFVPSEGASGGLIVIWNANLFTGTLVDSNRIVVTIHFVSTISNQSFHLSNIYGPSNLVDKAAFIFWLYHFDCANFEDWIVAGDFHLIRSSEDRNKPGANVNDIMAFNDLLQHLDLVNIPFQGRNFTWSNVQDDLLLEKLDWVFTSPSWTLSYPNTSMQVLGGPIFDHSPFVIKIGTMIPQAFLFRFENFLSEFSSFLPTVELHWNISHYYANAAKTSNSKFKPVRAGLKRWSRSLSNLSKLIHNCDFVLAMLDSL